jgi:hypothetical protein
MMKRRLWPFSQTLNSPQPHTLSLKAWPPEMKGEGLGVIGVVLVVVAVIVGSWLGVPVANSVTKSLSEIPAGAQQGAISARR